MSFIDRLMGIASKEEMEAARIANHAAVDRAIGDFHRARDEFSYVADTILAHNKRRAEETAEFKAFSDKALKKA